MSFAALILVGGEKNENLFVPHYLLETNKSFKVV